MIRELAEQCRQNDIQVILTTHSPYILEELPLESRVYILKQEDGVRQIVTGVNPEFAMTKMDQEHHPECDVFVEDERTAVLLTEILVTYKSSLWDRCQAIPYGSAQVGYALGQMVAGGRFPRATCASCRRGVAPLDVPCRRGRTNAGGAIGRKALDAGTVASGAGIKPGEPGKARHRDARDARCRASRCARTVAGGAIGLDGFEPLCEFVLALGALDRLDLSAAKAGHLLGVHRATVYRSLDGSMSVPIVVELLLRLMVRRGIRPPGVTASRHGQTSAKPRSGRSQAKSAKPIVHPNTRAKSKQAAVLALLSRPRGATIAAMMQRPAGRPIRCAASWPRRAPSHGLPLARRLHVGADRGRAAAASDGAAWNPASGGDRVAPWSAAGGVTCCNGLSI
jgi:hypothetical protein